MTELEEDVTNLEGEKTDLKTAEFYFILFTHCRPFANAEWLDITTDWCCLGIAKTVKRFSIFLNASRKVTKKLVLINLKTLPPAGKYRTGFRNMTLGIMSYPRFILNTTGCTC